MTAAQGHKIAKQTFNIKYYGRANAFALQANAEQFCKYILLPKIEAAFDQYDAFEFLHIDKLEIDVNSKSIADLDTSLASKIVSELKQALAEKVVASNQENVNDQENKNFDLLVFYLLEGCFKKSKDQKTIDFEEVARLWLQYETPEALIKILNLLPAVKRLLVLINDEVWWELLERLSSLRSFSIQQFKEDLLLLKSVLDQTAYKTLFTDIKVSLLHSLASNQSEEALFEEGQKLFITRKQNFSGEIREELLKGLKTTFLKSIVKQKRVEVIKDEKIEQGDVSEIYVTNAGLVLVATYLPLFFTNLHLNITDPVNEARALSLLHFIATAREEFKEWELVLPKLFIGIPLKKYVAPNYNLTEDDKQQADELLEAVITNWTVLKSTTINGLRQTFLQRSGALSFRDDKWRLSVETESFDLLLDHLPWQISMIKLPWMKHLLQVNWR